MDREGILAKKTVAVVTGAGSGIGYAVATELARAGYCVYATFRLNRPEGPERATLLEELAIREDLELHVLDLDVSSDRSCRAAFDQIMAEQGRIDICVNNAGMLMVGVTEAFTPEQLHQVFDTNAVSWLRVNSAVLPIMRRQRQGTLVYISSTTAHISEPFLGPYAAAKAAGETLAEVMGMEARSFGIDTIIVVPGAFTSGTNHFLNAGKPALSAVVAQYGDVPGRAEKLGEKLAKVDAANDGSLDVSVIGHRLVDALANPIGRRPYRIFVDAQQKGVDEVLSARDARQASLLGKFDLHDMIPPS